MPDTQLSPLDVDLGFDWPCDLNTFWALADSVDDGRLQRQVGQVLRARYTPGGQYRRTFRECGRLWGVSDQRAQNIVVRALRTMRHPSRVRQYARGARQ